MQPYLFPYIGYFQLIYAVDLFVFHDDVQWIKGGWINRNYILLNHRPLRWTLPVKKKSSYDLINQCKVVELPNVKHHIVRQIENAYQRAPFFTKVMPIVTDIITQEEKNVAQYILYSFKRLNDYLNLSFKYAFSSELQKSDILKGQDRVISICKAIHATEYINPLGGFSLYNKEYFKKAGISLCFLQPNPIKYQQLGKGFTPNLSIIDVLMFNSVDAIRNMLNSYKLI